jgi:hypothetical protein
MRYEENYGEKNKFRILRHIDPLLGNDRKETMRQRLLLDNSLVNTQQYWSHC